MLPEIMLILFVNATNGKPTTESIVHQMDFMLSIDSQSNK